MEAAQRIRLVRIIEKMEKNPAFSNGKAMYISPPTTIPINITGKKITVQSSFIIPQDALNPKTKNFPTNQIIQIVNNNDNIFFSF